MTFEIKIGSGSFNNIKKFHSNDEEFTIFINKNPVTLPLNVAVSISSTITDFLLIDNSLRDFNVVIDFRNPENLKNIASIISSQKDFSVCSISNKKDAMDFAEFGRIIGNEEFIKPLLSIIKSDTSPVSISNVIERIEEKVFLSQIDKSYSDISEEVSFIKCHFSELCDTQSFVEWCLLESNSTIVEEIICSKDIRLKSEDDLLSFIIKINGDFRYTHLFQYVQFEFCTITKCAEFIKYINREEFFSSSVFRQSILNCLGNRILYDYYSYKDINKYESRYGKEFIDNITKNSSEHLKEENTNLKEENTNLEENIANVKEENTNLKENIANVKEENTNLKENIANIKEENTNLKENIANIKEENTNLKENIANLKENIANVKKENTNLKENIAKGPIKILRSENKNGNVLLEASSTSGGGHNVYNLINEDEEKCFFSQDIKNSYFKASLKDNKTFILNKYLVKAQKGYVTPTNWILQGQKASNGEWISIDYKTNTVIEDYKEHTFDIKCSEILKAVKFTMEGTNGNTHSLILNSFDIIGTLCN